ncbi:hypothetical protein HYQ45_001093 [Verticillium longisporum]|uniref:Uncharacterized protein n=1 Tax=Verticillium longisporum TaxID=100787 RepID=A0A8I3AXD8_VERLO|nr:hypothetical protein HYQ45_001093 [Verticillium longisporum]
MGGGWSKTYCANLEHPHLIEKSQDFVDLASSAQVSTKIPPAISAALISLIYSLEAVNVQHRPCDATLPEPAVAESLPTSEPGVKLSGHFWPDLKKQLFALPADEAWVHPDLDCPVCREKMAFVGAYTLDGGLTTASAHALAALHSHDGGGERAAASLLYGCDAALETLPAPMDRVQLRRFPAVVVPEGGWPLRRCCACAFDDWRVQWAEDVLLLLLVICGDLVRPLMTTSEFVQRAGRKKIRSVKRKNLDELGAHYAAYRGTSLKKLEDLMAAARVKLGHVEEGTGMTWALDLWA